jgi:hypothetical protein
VTPAPPDFTDVRPGGVYDFAAVAGLFGVTVQTVERWVAAGKLAAFTTPGGSERRVLGAVLLAYLGGSAAYLPQPSETRSERRRRAEAADAEIMGYAKAK